MKEYLNYNHNKCIYCKSSTRNWIELLFNILQNRIAYAEWNQSTYWWAI